MYEEFWLGLLFYRVFSRYEGINVLWTLRGNGYSHLHHDMSHRLVRTLHYTGETPFVSSRSARTATADNSSISSVSALSSSPCGTDGVTTAAADIEAIHKGDPHASLYGRIATWRGSPDSLFGEGTLGEAIPDAAQDVVLAMLRPRPEDRRDTREVLRLPWLTLVDPADA